MSQHTPGPWEVLALLREEIKHLRRVNSDLLVACRLALEYVERSVEPSCDEGDVLEDGTIHDGSTSLGNALRAAISRATGREGASDGLPAD